MEESNVFQTPPYRIPKYEPKRLPAYLTLLLDITQERREKTLYLLVGSGLPALARVRMTASKWEGGSQALTKLECVVEEIDGVSVPKEVQKEQTITRENVGSLTHAEQAQILRQALARVGLQGRTVLAEDIEGHLRVAALRRRLKRS